MSYNPTTDFPALIRNNGGVAQVAEMPGLDFVVAALARAGLFSVVYSQTAPVTNQSTTVWVKPSSPSWVAEAQVFLWNGTAYVPPTPALWVTLLSPAYVFQKTTIPNDVISAATTLLAINRIAPTSTVLTLPALAFRSGMALQVVDWSSAVAGHNITLQTPDGSTIMQRATFNLFSTADQLAGVNLQPSVELNGWVIAP
jgi:hypothetical protein